jgi:hypothetical protein
VLNRCASMPASSGRQPLVSTARTSAGPVRDPRSRWIRGRAPVAPGSRFRNYGSCALSGGTDS